MPTEPHSQAPFRTTRWSLVAEARETGEEAGRALEALCRIYWFPLYAFARRSGKSAADSKDLVQGFFVEVLEKDLFARADAGKGRLRTFLLTAFRRHVGQAARREGAWKRGGRVEVLSIDALDAETWYAEQKLANETPEGMFDRQWALTVLDRAVTAVGRDWRGQGKESHFQALRPFLTRQPEADEYGSLEKQLSVTRANLKSMVHRLRGRFREALKREILETQGSGVDWREELQALQAALVERA